jgi:chemotaxis signal transduction protein
MTQQPLAMADLAEEIAWTGFDLGGEAYAVDNRSVERVLAATPVTALPFAPAGIEGVANVSGEVLPVVDLAALIGLVPSSTGSRSPGAQFLAVRIAHRRFVLRIDRLLFVAASLQVVTDDSATTSPIVGKASWRDRSLRCLASDLLGLGELLPGTLPAGAPGEVLDRRTGDGNEHSDRVTDDLALVVEAAGTPCGVPSDNIVEVLEEAALTPLPLVPPEVLGIIILRRQPLLTLSLAMLQGTRSASANPAFVVVSVGKARLALAVDAVRGLQRLAGTNLVTLDLHTVVGPRWLALANEMPTATAIPSAIQGERRRFLGVTVGDRTCALPLASVERILSPRPPIRLPNGAPSGVDGAVEYAGHIVPVTDARRWLSARDGGRTVAHVVVQQDGKRRVLAVSGIQRIVSLAGEDILPATDQNVRIAAVAKAGGRSLEILSTEALMASGEIA